MCGLFSHSLALFVLFFFQIVQQIQKEHGSFSNFLHNYVRKWKEEERQQLQPEQNQKKTKNQPTSAPPPLPSFPSPPPASFSPLPSTSPLSEGLSKELKKKGGGFVGGTIIQSFLHASGLLNGHVGGCEKRKGKGEEKK